MESELLDETDGDGLQLLDETDELIASLENEVQVFRKSIQETKARHQQQMDQTNSDMEKERRVYDQSKKLAERTIGAFKAQYDDVKKQVIEMAIVTEKLAFESDSKDGEIEQLGITVKTMETAVAELGATITTKNSEIHRLGSEVETKIAIIVELGAQLESKSDELSSIIKTKDDVLASKDGQVQELGAEIKALQEKSANKIKVLGAQLAAKTSIIEQLNAEIETKNDGIKQLIEEMDTIDTVVVTRDEEVADKLETLNADIDAKNNLIETKDDTIKDLEAIIAAAKEIVTESKETEQITAKVQSKHKEEIKSLMNIEKEKAASAQHLHDEQVQHLQEKYDAEIQQLHKKVEEESTASTSRFEDMIRKHEESVAAAEIRCIKALEDLKTDHKAEMEKLKESHKVEKDELKEHARVVVANESLATISGLKKAPQDPQTAMARLEEEKKDHDGNGANNDLMGLLKAGEDPVITRIPATDSPSKDDDDDKITEAPTETKEQIRTIAPNANEVTVNSEESENAINIMKQGVYSADLHKKERTEDECACTVM